MFLNSEVEPWVDVPRRIWTTSLVFWQQDRWDNGGARGLVAGRSLDGGVTWATAPIPGLTKCAGGAYDRATDPWVSFAPNGDVYQLALVFNAADFDHGLLVSKSTDGGLTYLPPQFVIRDLDANVFNDKQSITADSTAANAVYAVWDRLVFPSSERAGERTRGLPLFGVPWSRVVRANDERRRELAAGPGDLRPRAERSNDGNQIVVLPNGTLVDIFDEIQNDNSKKQRGFSVRVMRSTNKGGAWSDAILIDQLGTIGVTDPETGDDVRTGDIIPDIVVAPNGDLYAVWQDARVNSGGADGVALSRSTDGGLTWSPRIKVNQTPTNIPIGNQQAFTPSVDVAADGTVGVTYYDFRSNTGAAPLLTDYWVVHCHAACGNAANWGGEVKLTDVPFDMRLAPNAGGFFTGDYEGLASAGNDFGAFFSQPHGSDPGSIFFRRVGP